ncbi:MAG: hypothetical protein KGP12_09275 [Actinomycetales bacterium]|nr:hypothetical protein [Actinomycetales bacterium]
MSRSMSVITATTSLTSQVIDGGIDADRVALLLLAHQAQDLGVSRVLIDVMVDEDAPEPARLRAYGRVSSRTCALAGRPVVRERALVPA